VDTTDYIASGNLELYACGALSTAEAAEAGDVIGNNETAAEELAAIREALEAYAACYERNPRPALRRRILEQFAPSGSRPVAPAARSSTMTYKYLLSACLASLAISTFASYFFYTRWSETEDRNLSLLQEKNVMGENYVVIKSMFDKLYGEWMTVNEPGVRVYPLRGADTAQSLTARVYWNTLSHEVYLMTGYLPPPPEGMHYRLWALTGTSPHDAGPVLLNDDSELQQMKSAYDVTAWLISLEEVQEPAAPSQALLEGHR
jgi:hypothetical protein